MKIQKEVLCSLESCYAVNVMQYDGQDHYFAASEGPHPCLAFPTSHPQQVQTVWDGPGGCMTMVPLPGCGGEFLAIQKFFRLFQWEGAEVVWLFPGPDGTYQRKVLANIPYIHRIDILPSAGVLYFIGCSVSRAKDSLDDWRQGGCIYTAEIDPVGRSLNHLSILRDGLFQNHGYCRVNDCGRSFGLIGCAQGIFQAAPPGPQKGWSLTQVFDRPVSDMALADLDGDGVPELAAIEPFHGRYFRVYRQDGTGWRQIFEHPEHSEFYHVVWGGTLCGQPAFLGGCRRGRQMLFLLTGDGAGGISMQTIDEGVGPSNVSVYHGPDGDVILSANRERGEAALYHAEAD